MAGGKIGNSSEPGNGGTESPVNCGLLSGESLQSTSHCSGRHGSELEKQNKTKTNKEIISQETIAKYAFLCDVVEGCEVYFCHDLVHMC